MRTINRCLNKQLAELCQHSIQLEELTRKLVQLLPEELAGQCTVSSFNKGCLLLSTPNAAWASQVRYVIPELRDKLRIEAGMYQLSSIKVIVVEPVAQYEPLVPQKKYRLSEKAKASIISESQQCSYEPLQKALFNLANDAS